MEVKNIYLNKNGEGNIVCPECTRSKHVNASTFKKNQPFKITCECEHTFRIIFEQRYRYRKQVSLPGYLKQIYPESKINGSIDIEDISAIGIKFKMNNVADLNQKGILQLSFVLDDYRRSPLTIKGIIKYVKGQYVGLEFYNIDVTTSRLIEDYLIPSTPAPYLSDLHVDIMEKQKKMDEASCIEAAQRELRHYCTSLGMKFEPAFTGSSWDEAITRFRNYWQKHYICNQCHRITSSDSVFSTEFNCLKCQGGQFINTPKEMWNIILKHNPQKQRYFNLYDAFSLLEMSLTQFKCRYPNGFLVPMKLNVSDNPVIHQLKFIYKQSKELGIEFNKDDIEVTPTGKEIIEIRKIRNSQNLDQILIGRSPKSDIILDDKAVSQSHAYIYVSTPELKYYLVDLKSSNGTFLNKKRLQSLEKYRLSNGCEIIFGSKTKVAFFSSGGFYRYLSAITGRQKR